MIHYRLLADLVLLLHFAIVLFVLGAWIIIIAGACRGWHFVRNPWFRGIHLAAVGFVVALTWCGTMCPLTTLENELRHHGGQSSYPGDFIAWWVHELLFFDLPSWVFTLCYSVFGASVAVLLRVCPPEVSGGSRRDAD